MTLRSLAVGGSVVAAVVALVACGDPTKRSGFGSETEATEDKDTKGTGPGFKNEAPDGGSTCAINNANQNPDEDSDGDGYPLKYDCNECDPNTNQGAHDIPGNGLDEDCSGTPDDEEVDCDTGGFDMAGSDPMEAAKSMGICKTADPSGQGWGVIEAKWVRPDGSNLTTALEGVGILEDFGVNLPQTGKSFVALSSGAARGPNHTGYKNPSGHTKGYASPAPQGYPKESPACPGVTTGTARDGAALQLKIRVPSNAKSFKYQQNFFTWEYSGYICSQFNDFYVAMMDPVPAGLQDGNIAFDQDGNPISVNNSLLQVCNPGTYKGKTFSCPLGNSTLSGTGFEGHAATGWLTTQTDVEPGKEITLTFAIWDSGDGALDSTVLIDDFTWSAEPGNGTTTLPSVPK